MTEEEKITREEHPKRVAQGRKLAAFMKKRKEEELRRKEQSTEQSTEQSKEQPKEQSSVQSNDTYVSGVGILAVLAIGVCAFFAYPKNKKQDNDHQHEQNQPPKRRHML